MATADNQSMNVASFNPDNMVSAGLKDDFDAVILKARVAPFDYGGKIDNHILAAWITYKPAEDSGYEEFTQQYSMGDLEHFAPSKDGKTPVDLDAWSGDDADIADAEGYYALRVGKRDQLNNSSNWAFWLRSLAAAGYKGQWHADIRGFEGIKAHFNRMDPPKRSGIVTQPAVDDQGRTKDRRVLVPTDFLGQETPSAAGGGTKAAKGGAKTASKPNGAPPATAAAPEASNAGEGGDDFPTQVENVIAEGIEAAGGEMPKKAVPGLLVKAFQGTDRAKAVKLANEKSFYENATRFVLDEEGGLTFLQ